MEFKRLNTIVGWLVFVLALIIYTLTMEKTGSLWDCGEFLSCTYKLQVAHPPGAPFFMLVGKIFSLLSMGDTAKVAMMINFLSAVSTAFCSLFFFWSATILMRMVLGLGHEMEKQTGYFIVGASFLGAMAATFLDSMWFNALEGEVYAFSVFFMAFNVWAILKWKEDTSDKRDLWLLLIALLTGMSLGVHLLSLLVFPMIFLVYYLDKWKFSWIGFVVTFVVSLAFIQFIMKFILEQTPNFLGKLDYMFVNSFGLPFNSGAILGVFLIIGLFAFLIKKSHENPNFLKWNEQVTKTKLNTLILFLAFIYMGFTSYFMVVIRANANPPINMNVPDNFLTLKSYIAREQYGERPLGFGPHYPDVYEIIDYNIKGDLYAKNKETGKYEVVGESRGYVYDPKVKKFFPRMGHEGDDKKAMYRAWINPAFEVIDRATQTSVQDFPRGQQEAAEQYAQQLNAKSPGQYVVKDKLSFSDNISYFINYQLGFMYFRYMFWNLVGRTDEKQGTVNNDYGRWISGINLLDNLVGSFWGNAKLDQANKPEILTSNKGYNRFFFIPFILCVFGMIFTYKRNKEAFGILMVLFFATGIMQIVFHNQPPIEPRERDYVTAPSFWAFVLFLPFGAYWIYEQLKDKLSGLASPVALLIAASAPLLMGWQGWDDHDRSRRTSTLDFAYNCLISCPPNAILFAYGDNDTYPLWYAQEIEGIRPDVRVVNTSLIDGAPYISQLMLPMNDNPSVDLGFPYEAIKGEKRQVLRTTGSPLLDSTLSFDQLIQIVTSDDPAAKVTFNDGRQENFLPTTKTYFQFDKEKAIRLGKLTAEEAALVSNRIPVTLPSQLTKGGLIQLQLMNKYMLERPICFINSYSPRELGISQYLENRGMIVVFNPFSKSTIQGLEPTDIDASLAAINKFKYGNIKNNILLDENTYKSYISIKSCLARMALTLALLNKKDSAEKLLDKLYENIPMNIMRVDVYDQTSLQAAQYADSKKYLKLLSDEMFKNATAVLDWATNSSNIKNVNPYSEEVRNNLNMLNLVKETAEQKNMPEMASKAANKMKEYETKLNIALQR